MADPSLSNLARRGEIDSEVLRQRRDLYVVSIGLSVFYLAEGQVLSSGTMTFIPARVHEPLVFLIAAWVAFAYFLVRYWMVAPAAWKLYWEEVVWQTAASKRVRRIAAGMIRHHLRDKQGYASHQLQDADREEEAGRLALLRDRYAPVISFHEWTPKLDMSAMRRSAERNSGHIRGHQNQFDVPRDQRACFWLALGRALLTATYRERSFTDYVLPYLVAFSTIAIAVGKSLQ